MELFLDTANVNEIREAAALGVISGVTTNPSLIAREGRDFKEVVREIVGIVDGPVSAEVISTEATAMVAEAEELAQIHPNIVIKIPMLPEGLKAVSQLGSRGIKTNVTLVFSANQALLAALAGASYVSPFVGRLDDIGHDGIEVVADTMEIFDRHDLPTKVIAASVRHPLHVITAARAGAHIATVPYKIVMQMARHPLTDLGLKKFMDDWAGLQNR